MTATEQHTPGRAAAALSGVLAAASVLGVGHLVAAVVEPAASPFLATGAAMVDRTPRALKDFAIREFGSSDKLVLFASMAVVMVVLATVAGLLERRFRYAGCGLLVALGLVVVGAALQRPGATALFALPAVLGVLAGVLALRLLLRAAGGGSAHSAASAGGSGATARGNATRTRADGTDAATEAGGETDATQPVPIGSGRAPGDPAPAGKHSRRGFLGIAAGVGALAVATYAAGQYIGRALRDVAADRAGFVLPRPARPAPPIAPDVTLPVPGISPFTTSNGDFYRVDTALQLPALTSADWRLRIHGMVDREVEYTIDDLRERAAAESTFTLTCVSNEVGGDLLGTATWTGYRLADLLAEAGPRGEADMVLSTSVDGFTASTPLAALTDGRDALLAVGMNGEPLPVAHGYPARMVVPGLYGYVSATKWVVDLELTRFDRATAYWTDRGWAAEAPIKTSSRIDVPASFATVDAGRVTVGGVAWAQQHGIDRVEVQVDSGPWQRAELAAEYSVDTWRQWRWEWDAAPGAHTLRVRATDRTGATQTDARARPFPDGSTGWHSRVVTVR
ncbi:molybdopterin-dependent oxidoreductase [Nocardia harenae]|uniref:molybdopterin-dependent oxidoreductase n=1 Tax=Nocardia harenae TaxID=358707 RepID=UPI00082FEE31|nr:molybdopterin-dependent oxidoreductase [Nocardia harenae]